MVSCWGIIRNVVTPVISQTNDTLYSTNAVQYQWNLDGIPLNGDTLQYLPVSGDGNYTVTVTDTNGCTKTSQPFIITGIGTNFLQGGIQIYPNPADDRLEVTSNEEPLSSVELYNALGEKKYFSDKKSLRLSINVEDYAAGLYLCGCQAMARIIF